MVYEGSYKLGDLFNSRREKGRVGLPTLSVTLNDGLVDRDTLERKTDTNLSENEHLLVKKGDIAYNMMRMWQGASGRSEKDGLVSPAYIVLAPKQSIDSVFASYLFKSQRLIYLFWAYSYGLTSDRLRLYFSDFSKIPVDVPVIEEQTKIAKILSTWDTAIEITEKLIENSKTQKKALMQQLLTGKKRFPGFKKNWKNVTIKKMGCTISGGTPDTTNIDYWNGDVLWATPTDITSLKSRYINNTKRKITEKGIKKSSANLLPVGTLLVCTRATIGYLAIAEKEITTNQGFKSLVLNDEYDSEFVYYLFKYFKHEFIRYACGSTFLELSKKDFEKRAFNIPEIKEQKKIASVLNTIAKDVYDLKVSFEYLQSEKKALMQQLLTGKRRVKLTNN